MADKAQLTDEEMQWVKRPPTDAERAAIRGMPRHIAEGWLRRKRAGEVAEQRSEKTQVKLAEAMEGLGTWLQENGGKA